MGRPTATRMRPRLTFANVVSTLALFAAIAGGTALALPGKGRVQANDLKKNAVKAAAIAKNAVRASEIKSGAVGSSEIADGAVASLDVADQGLGYEDLGSNSVIARIRSTGAVQTDDGGEANPVAVPLSGNSWTQAANETDVLFGELTFTEPPVCTNGFVDIQYFLGGEMVLEESYSDDPGTTATEPFARQRPFVFEPGTNTPRTLELRVWDDCDNPGQDYTIERLALNVVAIR
jgi:hypothetical protein